MICLVCATEFSEQESESACSRCALFGSCRFVRCPNCGHESPAQPGFIRWLIAQGRAVKGAAAQCRTSGAGGPARPLCSGAAGSQGTVAGFDCCTESDLRKLLAMGILPGTELTLVRLSPCTVVRFGFSEFALDRRLAEAVLVSWEEKRAE